jgi:hypothetical protein
MVFIRFSPKNCALSAYLMDEAKLLPPFQQKIEENITDSIYLKQMVSVKISENFR